MRLRVLHTSDWHLGQTLHERDRGYEHDQFLSWLLDTLEANAVDAILIAGDVFDVANPPAAAERRWFRFLTAARARLPQLDIVVIAGNHDSARRLEAPADLLATLGIRVVGTVPRRDEELALEELWVPLRAADGSVAAHCAAVPFLRPGDLPRDATRDGDEPPSVAGARALLSRVMAAAPAPARATRPEALIAMGHGHLETAKLSLHSERRVWGGEGEMPVSIYPSDLDYVALGHLHLAQEVAGRREVRYAGSPIPLSLAEADYPHQVVVVEFEDGDLVGIETVAVPRAIDILRIPAEGTATREEVEAALDALPEASGDDDADRLPFLEVRLALDAPTPGLARALAERVAGRRAQLVKVDVSYPAREDVRLRAFSSAEIGELDPIEVFEAFHRAERGGPPDDALRAAFVELLSIESDAGGLEAEPHERRGTAEGER